MKKDDWANEQGIITCPKCKSISVSSVFMPIGENRTIKVTQCIECHLKKEENAEEDEA